MKKQKRWNTKEARLKQAAIRALQLSGKPLTVRQIITVIEEKDLFTFVTKTPANSLYSVIARSRNRSAQNQEEPTFQKCESGSSKVVTYRLTPSAGKGKR